jgi:hypothetical protein
MSSMKLVRKAKISWTKFRYFTCIRKGNSAMRETKVRRTKCRTIAKRGN